MNIPSVYRKAIEGFVIPPRTFFQMAFSAARGAFSLLNETNRVDFIKRLERGEINEGVISQAAAGPMVMLSLFNDVRNPLFKRYNLDCMEFLEGVAPALENFHNVSGGLENQLHDIKRASKNRNSSKEGTETDTEGESTSNDKEELVESFRSFPPSKAFMAHIGDEDIVAVMEHDWAQQAKKEPDSLAGQLSRMLTTELFQIHQVSAKTAFLLQNHARNVVFQEGSCIVNNVALLSARAFMCVEKENSDDGPQYETVAEADIDTDEIEGRPVGVAAQVEVLYDVTQQFSDKDAGEAGTDEKSSKDSKTEENTVVGVATLEGWLKGGPDGELRWRMALYRPAFEFAGIE